MIRKISLGEVEFISFKLAQEQLSYDEPIPGFKTRFDGVLESCLSVPFQEFGGKSLYRGLISKAAILFYLMIKNHPFKNGNKRVAMTTLLVFLYRNGKWIRVNNKKLYLFAVGVTESDPKNKDRVINRIESFLKDYLEEG